MKETLNLKQNNQEAGIDINSLPDDPIEGIKKLAPSATEEQAEAWSKEFQVNYGLMKKNSSPAMLNRLVENIGKKIQAVSPDTFEKAKGTDSAKKLSGTANYLEAMRQNAINDPAAMNEAINNIRVELSRLPDDENGLALRAKLEQDLADMVELKNARNAA